MRFDVLTLFPSVFEPYLSESIVGRARDDGELEVCLHDLRDEGEGRHREVDDAPFGGGAGMVLRCEPIARWIRRLRSGPGPVGRVVFLTPQGPLLDQATCRRLAGEPRLILLCGRYEGVDERIREAYVDEEISIGDYVLTGGELPALVLIDAVSRMLPGVVGNEASVHGDSLYDGLLKHPQYTRPREFEGMSVPPILCSGDHDSIARWRQARALERTRAVRPDLLERARRAGAEGRPS